MLIHDPTLGTAAHEVMNTLRVHPGRDAHQSDWLRSGRPPILAGGCSRVPFRHWQLEVKGASRRSARGWTVTRIEAPTRR